MNRQKLKIHTVTRCALFAAVLCICSSIVVPVGGVPLSLSLFAVILTANILPPKMSFVSVIAFVLAGTVGIPVFAGFQGGISVILGPTGGFVISYIPVTALISFTRHKPLSIRIISGALALGLCYVLGTVHYMVLTDSKNLITALSVCVFPFVGFDVLKFAAAFAIGDKIRNKLQKEYIM